jgi:hypothetical protein
MTEALWIAPMPRPAIKTMRIPNPNARTTEDRPFINPTRKKRYLESTDSGILIQ